MASVDGAVLSRLPFDDTSSRALKVLKGCDHCPTQTHLWTRARVIWQQVPVEFHSVHTEWFADSTDQLEDIAEQLRLHYSKGPLILVGTFNLPQRDDTLPLRTALGRLVQGTGLQEAFGSLAANASLPLRPTEFVSGLHLDYIFYRGLELVGASIHSDVECSDHMPLVASFRLSHKGVLSSSAGARSSHAASR
uniref:Endonuclease/exonuclease/phosphatase domain-containing protein n=1 Tax=Alexandrium andersonii TaxID=327968 RepID=A0A7S2B3Z5_9DINO